MPCEYNAGTGTLYVEYEGYWYKLGEGIADMRPSITQDDDPDFEVADDEEMLEMLGIKR